MLASNNLAPRCHPITPHATPHPLTAQLKYVVKEQRVAVRGEVVGNLVVGQPPDKEARLDQASGQLCNGDA